MGSTSDRIKHCAVHCLCPLYERLAARKRSDQWAAEDIRVCNVKFCIYTESFWRLLRWKITPKSEILSVISFAPRSVRQNYIGTILEIYRSTTGEANRSDEFSADWTHDTKRWTSIETACEPISNQRQFPTCGAVAIEKISSNPDNEGGCLVIIFKHVKNIKFPGAPRMLVDFL